MMGRANWMMRRLVAGACSGPEAPDSDLDFFILGLTRVDREGVAQGLHLGVGCNVRENRRPGRSFSEMAKNYRSTRCY